MRNVGIIGITRYAGTGAEEMTWQEGSGMAPRVRAFPGYITHERTDNMKQVNMKAGGGRDGRTGRGGKPALPAVARLEEERRPAM
jgi:hypothetical protein